MGFFLSVCVSQHGREFQNVFCALAKWMLHVCPSYCFKWKNSCSKHSRSWSDQSYWKEYKLIFALMNGFEFKGCSKHNNRHSLGIMEDWMVTLETLCHYQSCCSLLIPVGCLWFTVLFWYLYYERRKWKATDGQMKVKAWCTLSEIK